MPLMSYLQKNLAALSSRFTGVAAQIEAAQVPADFAVVKGTDGTPTYARTIISDTAKKIEWLGQTSMPAAGSPHVVKSLDALSNGQNGLGLSFGTGFEWAAFAQRLPRAQMVYVYEPDLPLLRMALEVCDLADLLQNGRVILLAGTAEDAAGQLVKFLAGHLGFDPPAVLHPLPTLTGERRNQFLTAGEAIVRKAVLVRQAVLAELHARCRPAAGGEAVVGFFLTPQYPTERPIQGELSKLAAPPVYVDRHETASLALRFEVLAKQAARGPVRIQSDLFRAQLAHVPMEIPVETWVPPYVGAGYWERVPGAGTLGGGDKVVVHHAYHAWLLEGRGVGKGQIEVRLLDVAGLGRQEVEAGKGEMRVELIADLPVTEAGVLGIQLPTHLAVFVAARELIAADYLTVHPGMAGALLRRALARAGVDAKVEDAALKEPMLRIIRDVLIPAVPLQVLAANLAKEGLPVTLIGDWGILPGVAGARRMSFQEFEGVGGMVMVHFDPCGRVHLLHLRAVAGGAGGGGGAIVHAAHPTDGHLGSLEKYLARGNFPAPQNLLSTLKGLMRDAGKVAQFRTALKN